MQSSLLRTITLHGSLLAVQLLALMLMQGPSLADPGFPLDDAWTHQVIARTFAETGTLGYEPLRYGTAATSLLWPLILAFNPAFLDLSPVLFTVLLGVLAYVAAGHLVLRMLLADGLTAGLALIGAVLFSVAGNGVWFAVSGMESVLIVVLSCAAVHFSFAQRLRWLCAAGCALGLVFLTRPECGALAVVVIGAAALRGERCVKRFLALTLPVAASVIVFAVLNFVHTGSVNPSTLSGRRWMWLATSEGWNAFDRVSAYLYVWADRLSGYTLGFGHPALFWTALGLALLGVVDMVQRGARRVPLLCLWAMTHLAIYGAVLPTPGHGGRYQPLTPHVFLMLVGLGFISVVRSLAALGVLRWPQVKPLSWIEQWSWLAGIPLTTHAVLLLQYWGYAHALAVVHVNATEVAMGESLRGLPAEAKIASFDIGGIGYFGQRPLLDLGGLVDPSVVPRLKEGAIADLLLERNVTYLVLPLTFTDNFPDPWNFADRLGLLHQQKLRLTPIVEHVSPLDVWVPGIHATWHCSPRQGLFHVEATHER